MQINVFDMHHVALLRGIEPCGLAAYRDATTRFFPCKMEEMTAGTFGQFQRLPCGKPE